MSEADSMPSPGSAVPGPERVLAYVRERIGSPDLTVEEVGRGDANIAYRVRGPGTDFVIRLAYHAAKGIGLAAQVARQASVLAHLEGRAVTGSLLWTDLERGVDGLPLLAMEYLPGRPLDYRASDLAAAGALYARLHETAGEPPATIARVADPRGPYLGEIRPWIARHGRWDGRNPAVQHELEQALARCEVLQLPAEPAVLIHGDGTDANWRITDDRARILDWDWCRVTHAAADLGHFLSPITTLRHKHRLLSRAEEALVLEAYAANRPGLDRQRFGDELQRFRALVVTHSASWTAAYLASLSEEEARATGTPDQVRRDKIAWLRGHIEPAFLARMREERVW